MRLRRLIWILPLSVSSIAGPAWGERVRVPEGTPVRVRLKADLVSDRAAQGDRVDLEVAQRVTIGGLAVIPGGAVAWGAVQAVKRDKDVKFDIEGLRLPNLQQIKLRSIREKSKNPGKDLIKVESQFGGGVGAPSGSEFTAYVDEDVEVDIAPAQATTASIGKPVTAAGSAEVKSTPPTQAAETPRPTTTVSPTSQTVQPPPPATSTVSAPTQAVQTPTPAASTTTPPAQSVQPPPPTASGVSTSTHQPQAITATSTPTSQSETSVPSTTTGPSSLPSQAQDWLTATDRVTVECYSEPSGADILIDGDFVGNTPSILKVPVGDHRLEIQLAGYKPVSQALNLAAGMGLRTIRTPLEKKE